MICPDISVMISYEVVEQTLALHWELCSKGAELELLHIITNSSCYYLGRFWRAAKPSFSCLYTGRFFSVLPHEQISLMQCFYSLGTCALTQLTFKLCIYYITGRRSPALGPLLFHNTFQRRLMSHYENTNMAQLNKG